MKKIILSSFLILVILTSSIYFLMPEKFRVDIENTRTKYSVYENGSFTLAATEYVNLFEGTTKMRASSREVTYWNDSNFAYAQRKSEWKDNITTFQTYTFGIYEEKIEEFPLKNEFQCLNCEGKIVHYEIRDILYDGETKIIDSPFSFGHNMEIEWEDGAYYSKVFQQKVASDKIIIRYRPKTNDETYSVRLFDPWVNSLNTNLKVWLKLNESSGTLFDSVFNVNLTGTNATPVYSATGIIGTGVAIDSYGDAFTGFTNSVLDFGTTTDFTLNYWFNLTKTNVDDINFLSSTIYSYATGFYCGVQYDNVTCSVQDGSVFMSITPSQDEFHMLTYMRNDSGKDFHMYVDGVYNQSRLESSLVNADGGIFFIGENRTYSYANITLDEIGIWERVLTQDEIDKLYNSGTGITYGGYLVQLVYPTDFLNISTSDVWLNFTNNSVLDTCVWSSDNFVTNNSIDDCNNSVIILSEDNWNISLWVNDTGTEVAQDSVYFTVDLSAPKINITYPLNDTYNVNVSNLNYTIDDLSGIKCWYSDDFGVTNFTEVVAGINFTDVYSDEGTNTRIVFCNDSVGNENQTNITFFKDTTINKINLSFNGVESNLSIELNTTVNITGNATTTTGLPFIGLVCLDIDHPDYGYNYTCSSGEVTLNLSINYFRKNTFWNDTTSWNFSDFTYNGTNYLTNESLNFTSHQYAEVDDLRFNISSTDNVENVIFYQCNSSNIDRYYQGYLFGNNIYLNQSVDSGGTVFSNFENITFNNPGNATIYFYLDDNATIQNITMNVTGKDYGFSYFDSFTNFSNIDESQTTAQLHYGPGGFIQAPNSSLTLFTFDDFNDNSLSDVWYYDPVPQSESWGVSGVRETGGYLEAYFTINNGYEASGTNLFYPFLNATNYYTFDYLSFNVVGYYAGQEDSDAGGCSQNNVVKFSNQNIFSTGSINSDSDYEYSASDVDFEMTKINHTHWEINVSGTETQTTVFATDCDGTGNVVRILNYTNGTTDTDWADTDCTDTSTSLDNSSIYAIDTNEVMVEFDQTLVDQTNECFTSTGYLRLDNLKNKRWNRTNGTVTSNSIFDASSNIISATMNVSNNTVTNESFALWLSANNGVNWESATNGVLKTFTYPGTNIKYKIDFNLTNPGYNNNTLRIINVTVETPISNVSDVEFDFGNDGIWDYKINGTLGGANTTLVISMPNADISSSFTSRRALYDHLYKIPMRIYSASAGQIDLDVFNVTYNPNPVILNYSSIQTFLDTYGSNETNFSITIAGANGTVNVSDIKFDYAGGNDTINITFRDLTTYTITRYIYPFYSRWDYLFEPLYVDFLEFIPSTPTSLNVTPYGQTNSTPILNLTNYGYGDKNANLSVYLNDTSSCVNLTMSTTWNKEDGYMLNSTWRELNSDTIYLEPTDIYLWADYSCSYNNWTLFNPYIYFRQCASGTYCSGGLG